VEDLAAGFFRGLLALVHAVARLAVDIFWHAVGEVVADIVGRIFSAIFKSIAFVVRVLLAPVEWLYRVLFDRVRRSVTSPALAHLVAVVALIFCGFMIGAGASLIYHQGPDTAMEASLADQS
jgi:hypothetical protein